MHSNVCYHTMMTSRISHDDYHAGLNLVTMCSLEQHSNPYHHMSMSSRTSKDIYQSGCDLLNMCLLQKVIFADIYP